MPLSSFACCLQVINFCLHLWTIAFPQCPLYSPALSHPFPGSIMLVRPCLEQLLVGCRRRSCRARWGKAGRVGAGGSFSAGPWRRAVSEHVPLRFRRGQKGLSSGKELLQAAPTASALHLLHPPSSPSLVPAAGATRRDSLSQRALLLQPKTSGFSACWEL